MVYYHLRFCISITHDNKQITKVNIEKMGPSLKHCRKPDIISLYALNSYRTLGFCHPFERCANASDLFPNT